MPTKREGVEGVVKGCAAVKNQGCGGARCSAARVQCGPSVARRIVCATRSVRASYELLLLLLLLLLLFAATAERSPLCVG